jgi:hypothetical protein
MLLILFPYRSDNATFPKELSIPPAIAKECLGDIKIDKEEVAGDNADNNASQAVATTGIREGVSLFSI